MICIVNVLICQISLVPLGGGVGNEALCRQSQAERGNRRRISCAETCIWVCKSSRPRYPCNFKFVDGIYTGSSFAF